LPQNLQNIGFSPPFLCRCSLYCAADPVSMTANFFTAYHFRRIPSNHSDGFSKTKMHIFDYAKIA